jgi:hypothetical protein
MIPKPAQYLVRFDDFCPTMSRAGWERFGSLIQEFGIRPILAVVPDNQDPDLMVEAPDVAFWDRMRKLESAGATIAIHGYRHVCVSRGTSGLFPLHRETEFAGVAEEKQAEWLNAGLQILRGHGLNPKLWVAPRHGFDDVTLRVLRRAGISFISDGFTRGPFMRGNVTWIPQQLWEPVQKSRGLWTICIHSNTAPESLLRILRDFLRDNAEQFTSFERVAAELKQEEIGWLGRAYEAAALMRVRASKRRKQFARWTT